MKNHLIFHLTARLAHLFEADEHLYCMATMNH